MGVRGGGHRGNFAATLSEVLQKAVLKLLKAQAQFNYPRRPSGRCGVEDYSISRDSVVGPGVTNPEGMWLPCQQKALNLKEVTDLALVLWCLDKITTSTSIIQEAIDECARVCARSRARGTNIPQN